MPEPHVVKATIRDSETMDGFDCLDIECWFSDGQKFAPIEVDADCPKLAEKICAFLNGGGE